jgi:methylenetetrahydrofolate dehydrogenase (NADP+)/methenyltetrahydrofolate cyclohydrolase
MNIILKGSPVANAIKQQVAQRISAVRQTVTLGIIRFGEKPSDLYYEKNIQKTCSSIGMNSQVIVFKKTAFSHVEKKINAIVNAADIHGIVLFSPLPPMIDSRAIYQMIPVEKDIDGLNMHTAGALYTGGSCTFPPCTADACLALLKFYNIDLPGKYCVIIGRSLTVGKPLSLLLLNENATVTICHSHTKQLAQMTRQADILITAIGQARMITAEFVNKNQTVLDVGINADPHRPGCYCGDVDFEQVSPIVKRITPVPGGIGSITTAILCEHTFTAFQQQSTADTK